MSHPLARAVRRLLKITDAFTIWSDESDWSRARLAHARVTGLAVAAGFSPPPALERSGLPRNKSVRLLPAEDMAVIPCFLSNRAAYEAWREQLLDLGRAARAAGSEAPSPVQSEAPHPTPGDGASPISGDALKALFGDNVSVQILEIARSQTTSADNKMREICYLDRRMLAKNSVEWAEALGITDSGVRQTLFWREDRPRLKGDE
jgi:hypothetical protein